MTQDLQPPQNPSPQPDSPPEPSAGRKAAPRMLWIVKLAIVVAAGGCLLAIVLPTIDMVKERANRGNCANNLRTIGQALRLYANDHKCYPRTYYDPTLVVSFKADYTGGAKCNRSSNAFAGSPNGSVGPNNTLAAMFLLIRAAGLNEETFICPSSNQEKDQYTYSAHIITSQDVCNFASTTTISYSFTNPYPTSQAIAAGGKNPINSGYKWSPKPTDFAIAADRNDGFTAPAEAAQVAGLTSASPRSQQRVANSRNHERDGQNVLYDDGHVEWAQSMWVGTNNDGIYTAAIIALIEGGNFGQLNPATSKDTITADPQFDLDTVLIPKF